MKERNTQDKIMLIQNKSCAFGDMTQYEPDPENVFRANIKLTHGTLQEGVPCYLPLIPFDIRIHGLNTTTS